jgi:hypothetical protein
VWGLGIFGVEVGASGMCSQNKITRLKGLNCLSSLCDADIVVERASHGLVDLMRLSKMFDPEIDEVGDVAGEAESCYLSYHFEQRFMRLLIIRKSEI